MLEPFCVGLNKGYLYFDQMAASSISDESPQLFFYKIGVDIKEVIDALKYILGWRSA
jgi:hypothetical protein